MTTKNIAIGTRVRATDFPPRGLDGTVIAHACGFHLVQFDRSFPQGHDGFHGLVDLTAGEYPEKGSTDCWYLYPEFIEVIEQPTNARKKVKKGNTGRDVVLQHLLSGRSITPLEALGDYGIFRLAARIFELKKKGHKINTTIKVSPTGKQYAEYSLVSRNMRAA